MVKKEAVELSEYELQRQANIAERDALLKQLAQDAASAGLGPKPVSKPATNGTRPSTKKKKAPIKRLKEEVVPRRTSSRLAGITADSEVAKRKADDQYEAAKEVERAKKQRVSGDLSLGDIVVAGKEWDRSENFLVDVIAKRGADPYERTFGETEVRDTTDKELRALREKMSGLAMYDGWEPNRIKITPERIYSMTFHPTPDKPLLFAGDKLGNLGIFDASQTPPSTTEGANDDADDDSDPSPSITSFHTHTRTISALTFSPTTPSHLYTASYDSSLRLLDLSHSSSHEIYAPTSPLADEPLSGIDLSPTSPHVLFFSRLDGYIGRTDTREKPQATALFALSDKKIGGFSLHPQYPHFLATASLDRYMRLWDLRKTEGVNDSDDKRLGLVGEHLSALSVSHAAFNGVGQVATASYDDTIKIHSFADMGSWPAPSTASKNTWAHPRLGDEEMKPTVVRHNNQTGRWVTILRPQWQLRPPRGEAQRFVIGNMNRFVDVYAGDGQQLAQLGGDGVTAVPAVAVMHPSREWVAGGTASGKVCLWM